MGGFAVGVEMGKVHVLALIQLLNNLIKSNSHTMSPLSGAFALSVKCILNQILSCSDFGEVQEQLIGLKRLLDYAHGQKQRQLFIALGNCLPQLLQVHTAWPVDGITEGIMMSVLDQLSERHIECFRSILAEHQRPV